MNNNNNKIIIMIIRAIKIIAYSNGSDTVYKAHKLSP